MNSENFMVAEHTKLRHQSQVLSGVLVQSSHYAKGNWDEHHLMCKPELSEHFDQQLGKIISAIDAYVSKYGIQQDGLIMLRFFVSDCANQMDELQKCIKTLEKQYGPCAISIVQQPPLDGNKVVAWVYLVDGEQAIQKSNEANYLRVSYGEYEHIYHTQLLAQSEVETSYQQTDEIFKSFNNDLEANGMTMMDNCIRTWIYVKDVDYNYNGVVVSRREYFERLGMTADTHFISSTGIEGRHLDYHKNVLMDAYSIKGIDKQKIQFLQALDHLNPTHEYGVTFERGTSVDLNDRRHIYLSGTASIDNKGEVVYPQQIDKQIERTLENMQALLNDAGATLDDMAQLIIYLRDVADATVVDNFFKKHLSHIPKVIVLAPVCRPGWLIEMECVAIK